MAIPKNGTLFHGSSFLATLGFKTESRLGFLARYPLAAKSGIHTSHLAFRKLG
jgi:hypothetical protein